MEAFSTLLGLSREVALQLDGHLGDGLEDPIAVMALLETFCTSLPPTITYVRLGAET
jgi:hypothetical protein